jgi:hypothetical protein
VLGVMSDGNWIRGVTVPSHIVMWVTWQWNTWRNGAITYCDVGDLEIEYVAYRYLARRDLAVDRWNLSIRMRALARNCKLN